MTPRKRRVLLLGLAGCLAALACVVFLAQDRSAINPANYEKIQVGMPLAEVETILGGPARDESSGPIREDSVDENDLGPQLQVVTFRIAYAKDLQLWTSDRLMIRVEVEQGRVAGKASLEVRRMRESPWQKVRRWLRL
jgi:hypothetical protein